MSNEPPFSLRDYQVSDLAFHIASKKSLNLSDPGCGKTPTVCVFAYYQWVENGARTVWTMPKSLLKKNKDEFKLFTRFTDEDVVILDSAHAPLTKGWNGPTIPRTKTIRSMRFKFADGTISHGYEHKERPLFFSSPMKSKHGPAWASATSNKFVSVLPDDAEIVEPLRDPFGQPQYLKIEEEETVKDMIAYHADAKVFICTFAFLRDHWKRLLDTIPSIKNFMIDELHMAYGHHDSQQTKSFFHTAKRCDTMIGMTGTLIDGTLDTVFPAIHAIEPRYYGSFQGFRDQHALFVDDYDRVQVWHNEAKIGQILLRHAVRHTFEEVYGDEPVHFETVVVPMGEKCREAYEQFHDNAMLELEDDRVLDGSLPGVALIRASQIMAHPETMGIAKGEVTGKDQKLAEYAVEGQPMLVFAQLQPEQRRCVKVLEECGLRVGLINADVSAKQRSIIDLQFRNGELDAIVASGPTASIGFNWERAGHVVFVSIDFKDVNVLQAYRRASRGTRKTVLRVTALQYEDSVDQRKYQIIRDKSETAHKVDPTRRVLEF